MPSKADFNKLQNSVDTLASRFDKVEKNEVVQAAKTERIEHWVIKAAEKIEVPYKP